MNKIDIKNALSLSIYA